MCSTLRTYSSSAWFVVAHELRHMCGAMKSKPSCRVVVQVDPPHTSVYTNTTLVSQYTLRAISIVSTLGS